MDKRVKQLHRYRWMIWGILCLAYIIVFFQRLALGTVKDDLITTFGLSATAFANLSATYFYAYLIMQIPTGILLETLGVRLTVSGGMVLTAIGSLLFGTAATVVTAFIGRLLVGVGVSVVFVAILKTQAEWFYEREFGTMSGLTVFVGNIGGLLAQTPLVFLVGILTWRGTFMAIGIITIIVAILCFIYVRNKPTDLNLPSIQELEGRTVTAEKIQVWRGLAAVCKNPYTWPPFIMFGGIHGAFIAFTGTWGQSYLKNVYRISDFQAADLVLTAVLGLILASVVFGRISDYLRQRRAPMLILGLINLAVWVLVVFYKQGQPPLSILGPLFFTLGVSSATYVLGYACCKEVNSPRYEGISLAVINSGGFIGASVIPVIIGMVVDKYQNILSQREIYSKGFFFCLLGVVLSYLAIFFIKETGCRNVYKSEQ